MLSMIGLRSREQIVYVGRLRKRRDAQKAGGLEFQAPAQLVRAVASASPLLRW